MKITINRQSKNLGYSWTTAPTGHGTEIESVNKPDVKGGWKVIFKEIEHHNNICGNSTFNNTAFFVSGKKVIQPRLSEIIDKLWNYPTDHRMDEIEVVVDN